MIRRESDAIFLCEGEGAWLRKQKRIEENVVTMGSVPCKTSSEVHVNGQHVVGFNTERVDSQATMMDATEEQRLKHSRLMSCEGHKIIGPGYLVWKLIVELGGSGR
jgi:hypothetical protein